VRPRLDSLAATLPAGIQMTLIWRLLSLVLTLSLTDSNSFEKHVKVPALNTGYFGGNITISCTYVSDKTELVVWYRIHPGKREPIAIKEESGNQVSSPSSQKGRFRIVGQASLFIKNLTFADEGDYRCEIDMVDSADTRIRVMQESRSNQRNFTTTNFLAI